MSEPPETGQHRPDGVTDPATILHASTVAIDGRGVLIEGPSGAGKSSLALALMAFGARLVADDRTLLRRLPTGGVEASAPPNLPAMIEARGVGLLPAVLAGPASVSLVVDLSRISADRLPPQRWRELLGQKIALLLRGPGEHFPQAVLQYVRGHSGG